jgi:hypothetical protein
MSNNMATARRNWPFVEGELGRVDDGEELRGGEVVAGLGFRAMR